jgi:hypothetical protein
MCYWILPTGGIPIARSTVQAISEDQKLVESVMQDLSNLDAAAIYDKFKNDKVGLGYYNYSIMEDDERDGLTYHVLG